MKICVRRMHRRQKTARPNHRGLHSFCQCTRLAVLNTHIYRYACLCTYIQYIRTYIHTYIQTTYKPTNTQTYIHTYTDTYTWIASCLSYSLHDFLVYGILVRDICIRFLTKSCTFLKYVLCDAYIWHMDQYSSTSVHVHLRVCSCMKLPTTGLAASCNIAEKVTSQGTWNQQQRQSLGAAPRQKPVCCCLSNEKVAGSNIVQHVRD